MEIEIAVDKVLPVSDETASKSDNNVHVKLTTQNAIGNIARKR